MKEVAIGVGITTAFQMVVAWVPVAVERGAGKPTVEGLNGCEAESL